MVAHLHIQTFFQSFIIPLRCAAKSALLRILSFANISAEWSFLTVFLHQSELSRFLRMIVKTWAAIVAQDGSCLIHIFKKDSVLPLSPPPPIIFHHPFLISVCVPSANSNRIPWRWALLQDFDSSFWHWRLCTPNVWSVCSPLSRSVRLDVWCLCLVWWRCGYYWRWARGVIRNDWFLDSWWFLIFMVGVRSWSCDYWESTSWSVSWCLPSASLLTVSVVRRRRWCRLLCSWSIGVTAALERATFKLD